MTVGRVTRMNPRRKATCWHCKTAITYEPFAPGIEGPVWRWNHDATKAERCSATSDNKARP